MSPPSDGPMDTLTLDDHAETVAYHPEIPSVALASDSMDAIQVDDDSMFGPKLTARAPLHFEAQRRSAQHHLGQYLDMRRNIWQSLIGAVNESRNGSLGDHEGTLIEGVWRLIATRDQLSSDLTMMTSRLDGFVYKSTKKVSHAFSYSTIFFAFIDFAKSLEPNGKTRYLRPALWVLLGLSVAKTIYSGLSLSLFVSLKKRVAVTQENLERDELLEKHRTALSGWIWTLLQFSDAN